MSQSARRTSATGEPRPSVSVILVAAGRGERLGAPDKAFLPLAGRPMVAYALDAIERAALGDIILVVGDHTAATATDLVAAGGWERVTAIVPGGARRQDSVAAGLAAVAAGTEVVVVHDAARPLASDALFQRCAVEAARVGAAITAVPLSDTLKRVTGPPDARRIAATVNRDDLWAAQTPQAFRADLLRRALAESPDLVVTDEAALFEAFGWPVAIVPGSPANLKVTRPEDLAVAEALLMRDQSAAFSPEIGP